jgi:copper chaperone CopZ
MIEKIAGISEENFTNRISGKNVYQISEDVAKAMHVYRSVTSATVDFDKKTASVTFDPDKASPATLTKATSDAGYPSSVHN